MISTLTQSILRKGVPKFILLVLAQGCSTLPLLFFSLFSISSLEFKLSWMIHCACHVLLCGYSLYVLGRSLLNCDKRIQILCIIALGITYVTAGAEAFAPIIARDALLYHLAVPKWWLECGAQCQVSWHEWSFFPLQTSLAYAGFLQAELIALIPWYHLSYSVVLAALTIEAFSSEQSAHEKGLIASSLFLTTPLVVKLIPEPLADIPALLYLVNGGILLLSLLASPRHPYTFLSCAGFSFGFALATKYVSFLSVGLIWPIFTIFYLYKSQQSKAIALRSLCLGTLCIILPVLPWLVRNFLWTSNPVYPFLQGFFGQGENLLAFSGSTPPLLYRHLYFQESWLEILLLPLRIFFQGEDDNPRYFAGVLSPFLLTGALAVIIHYRSSIALRISLLFSVLYLLIAFCVFYTYLRYQLITVYLLCLSVGLFWSTAYHRKWINLVLWTVALHLCFGLSYQYQRLKSNHVWGHLFGEISNRDYISRNIADYEIIDVLNTKTPPESKVFLLLTGNKFFLIQRETESSYFSQDPVVAALSRNSSIALLDFLRERGITHLIFHERRTHELVLSLNLANEWQDFMTKACQPIASRKGRTICRLRNYEPPVVSETPRYRERLS
jgi:hypothetical protein